MNVLPAPLRPDFVIVGAMKSGTTTLQSQLAAQPGVFMTTPKEPNFFSDPDVFALGPDWYRSLFEGADSGDLKGEASTHYTKLPTYPETVDRLASAVPNARIVYVIRNPVERAVSHYLHAWTQGEVSCSLSEALQSRPEITEYGRYGMQIAPYIERFGAEAILLTSLEQLKASPEDELNRIGRHIGMPSKLHWQTQIGAKNVSSDRVRKLPLHSILVENPVATALRRGLIPKAVRERIRQSRTFGDRPELTPGSRQVLETTFLKDLATLRTLFPGHAALGLCYPFADP